MLVVLLAFPVTGVVRDERRRLMCVVCEVAFAPIFFIISYLVIRFNHDYFKLMLMFGPDAMSSSNQREVIVLVSV